MPSGRLVAKLPQDCEGRIMNRPDNSGFANWWFTVDRVALFCMLA